MVSVLHNSNFLDFAFLTDDEIAKEKARHLTCQELLLVAEVPTDSLAEAYRLTNHIDHPWHENEGLRVFLKTRSTSVGDVLRIDGKQFLVTMIGFLEF